MSLQLCDLCTTQKRGVKKMNRTWTYNEEQYLITHYATTSNAEIAEVLGKTESAVKSKISRLYQRLDNKRGAKQ